MTLDPHKLLYQSYECGGLLVREPDALRSAFEIVRLPPRHARPGGRGEPRRSRNPAEQDEPRFKLWLSIETFGLAAFRRAIDRSLDLAEHAARRIRESDELELVAPPSLGIVCFRRRPAGVDDEVELAGLNAGLVAALEASGDGFVSSTTLEATTPSGSAP